MGLLEPEQVHVHIGCVKRNRAGDMLNGELNMATSIVELAHAIAHTYAHDIGTSGHSAELSRGSMTHDAASTLFRVVCRDRFLWEQTIDCEDALYTVCLSLMAALRDDSSATGDIAAMGLFDRLYPGEWPTRV